MSTEQTPLQPLYDPGCEDHAPELYSPIKAATGVATLDDIGPAEKSIMKNTVMHYGWSHWTGKLGDRNRHS